MNYSRALARKLLFTCEHGGNGVPPEFRMLFKTRQPVLASHRGWDAGALVLARHLAKFFDAPLFFSETTRLLIELNRSLHHPNLFSEFTKDICSQEKEKIIEQYYQPYRQQVVNTIDDLHNQGFDVIHFSIHSFTPRLGNLTRKTDIGLLYDSARKAERLYCIKLQKKIKESNSQWIVRRNYPYRGNADGFTTWLRKEYSDNRYCGIEIEINQKYYYQKKRWHSICTTISKSIKDAINYDEKTI